jgi:hypothetical protein
MEEEARRVVDGCKALVRAMVSAEAVVMEAQARVQATSLSEAFGEVLSWLQSTEELPRNSFVREIAREIIAQLAGAVALQGFRGSPQSYIA